MKRFLVELRLMNCRLDSPTEVIIPNMTQKMPPTIGSKEEKIYLNQLKLTVPILYYSYVYLLSFIYVYT
jgi:hypothetical protein